MQDQQVLTQKPEIHADVRSRVPEKEIVQRIVAHSFIGETPVPRETKELNEEPLTKS